MEWTEEVFEPVSEVAGMIEISFNKKSKEFDLFEPIQDQLILTLGKTGRANRLTIEDFDSSDMRKMEETFRDLAQKMEKLEEEQKDDIDDIESGVNISVGPSTSAIKNKAEDPTPEGELVDHFSDQFEIDEIKQKIENLEKTGDLFRPEEGKVQAL